MERAPTSARLDLNTRIMVGPLDDGIDRAYMRGPDLKPVRDLLMVAIDSSDFSYN